MQRLERQVEGVQRRGGGAGGLLGGLQIGAGIAAAQQAFSAMGGVFQFIRDSVVTLNSELERNVTTFQAITGSVEAAGDVVAALRREAAVSPFNDREILQAGRTLIAVSERSTESLLGLVRVAEILAAMDPAQGLEGAGVALREALSGDFESLIRRFEFSRQAIATWRAQGVSNLEIVRKELERLGFTSELVERLGRTFEGRAATIRSFFDELRQRAGAGLFDRLSDLFGRLVRLIDDFGDRLRVVATGIGTFLGAVAERIGTQLVGPLRALVELFAPGLWDQLVASMERVPPVLERQGQAAQQAASSIEDQTRTLARLGVEAAGLQVDAERVRRTYDDQIQPLERQLRLLQQSAELQRVQNALATNRATVEGLRLDREISALRRAAGGATDPNAPGLSLRQRLIALALQDRELQREQLGLEGEHRPLIQNLQQEIARLQEEQRKALEPLERGLQLRKDEVDAINLVRKQIELLALDDAAAAKVRMEGWTSKNPGALDEVKQRGEELAASWLKGWQDELDKNGGDVWKTMGVKLDEWYTTTGKPLAERVGGDLGRALGDAAGSQAATAFKESIRRALFEGPSGAEQIAEGVAADVAAGRIPAGSLPTVTVPVSPPGRPGAGAQITINVGDLASGPGFQDRLRVAFAQFWQQFIQSEAAADPGASSRLQGSGRTP